MTSEHVKLTLHVHFGVIIYITYFLTYTRASFYSHEMSSVNVQSLLIYPQKLSSNNLYSEWHRMKN